MTNTRQVCEVSGLTVRQINNWIDHGWVTPQNEYTGPGHAYVWASGEIDKICVMARLTRATGMLPHKAAQLADRHLEDTAVPMDLGEGLTLMISTFRT